MDSKKDIFSQINEINSIYNIKGSNYLLDLFENLAFDYQNGKLSEKTSQYLKSKFSMRETDIGSYIELVLRTNYFELRKVFDSFEKGFIPTVIL